MNRVHLQRSKEQHTLSAVPCAWLQTPAPTRVGTNAFQHFKKNPKHQEHKYFSKTILIKKGKKKNNQPEADIQQYMLCSNLFMMFGILQALGIAITMMHSIKKRTSFLSEQVL